MRSPEYRLAWARLEGRTGHEVGRLPLAMLYREETGGCYVAVLVA